MATVFKMAPRIGEDEEPDLSGYMEGPCYALAIAVSEGTGLPIVGLIHEETVWHAAVRGPDGILYDARGKFNIEEFGVPFGISDPCATKIVSREELDKIKKSGDLMICIARRLAEEKWPELRWKPTALTKKVLDFADAFEQLCRKHGMWLRAPFGTIKPVISLQEGDEHGIEVTLCEDGRTYTLDRLLKHQAEQEL